MKTLRRKTASHSLSVGVALLLSLLPSQLAEAKEINDYTKEQLKSMFIGCDLYVNKLKESNRRLAVLVKLAKKAPRPPTQGNTAWKAVGCLLGGLGSQAISGRVGLEGLAGSGACFLVLELAF